MLDCFSFRGGLCIGDVRLGQIGLGKMGMLHLMNAVRHGGVRVAAAADSSKAELEKAKRLGVSHLYRDYHEMMSREDLEGVVISLPSYLRLDPISVAAERGCDIFVDKPLATTFGEACQITDTVKKYGVKAMVCVNFRYLDCLSKMRKDFHDGKIGDVEIGTFEFINNGPFSASLVPSRIADWYLDPLKSGGGALMDLGWHLIDLFNWFFGRAEVLFAFLGHRYGLAVEDSATVVLRSSATGTRGVLNCGWFSALIFPLFDFEVVLHGTCGYLSSRELTPRSLHIHAMKSAMVNLGRRLVGKRIHPLRYTYYYESHALALYDFIECLLHGYDFPVSLESECEVVQTIQSVYEKSVKAERENCCHQLM